MPGSTAGTRCSSGRQRASVSREASGDTWMSWLSGPQQPPRTHPAVRGINDTTAGRSAVLSGTGDTKHSWQHTLRYRAVDKQHVGLKHGHSDSRGSVCACRAPEVEIEGSFSLSTADAASWRSTQRRVVSRFPELSLAGGVKMTCGATLRGIQTETTNLRKIKHFWLDLCRMRLSSKQWAGLAREILLSIYWK